MLVLSAGFAHHGRSSNGLLKVFPVFFCAFGNSVTLTFTGSDLGAGSATLAAMLNLVN